MKLSKKVFSYTTQGYFDKKDPIDVVEEQLKNTLSAERIVSILYEPHIGTYRRDEKNEGFWYHPRTCTLTAYYMAD